MPNYIRGSVFLPRVRRGGYLELVDGGWKHVEQIPEGLVIIIQVMVTLGRGYSYSWICRLARCDGQQH